MYPLSQSELEVLRNFLDDHLQTGFICQTSSSHGALVIFALKKDKTLCLCVDFQGLNEITKKNQYPLLFISDLFTTAGKARIYTTIDLQHAYHLVCIADGDEWKTAL